MGSSTTENNVEFAVQNVWVLDPQGTAQVLENIDFIVSKVDRSQRTVDLTIQLRSVAAEKIFIEGSIPGAGLALQLNPERSDWAAAGAQGEFQPNPVPYLSPWLVCSYRDDRRSTRSGLAILQDSRNPGFAQANWLIEGPDRVAVGVPDTVKVELRPGQTLEFRYRFILYHLAGSKVELTKEYARFMSEGQQRE